MSGGTRPEFSRLLDRREVTGKPITLTADADERAALAERFALVAIDSLTATLDVAVDGERFDARGRLRADIVQSCAVSGDDLPVTIDEDIAFSFVPAAPPAAPDEEIELADEELDQIPYEGGSVDLGEAVAQSLALAIDPYATGPNAEAARAEHGLAGNAPEGPLQRALGAALKREG